jgi:hypothetical protein
VGGIFRQNHLGLWLGTLKPSMADEISCSWNMKSRVATVEEQRTSAVGDVVGLLTFKKGFVFDEERAENNKTKRYVVAITGMGGLRFTFLFCLFCYSKEINL